MNGSAPPRAANAGFSSAHEFTLFCASLQNLTFAYQAQLCAAQRLALPQKVCFTKVFLLFGRLNGRGTYLAI
jgi:hypothetical protein